MTTPEKMELAGLVIRGLSLVLTGIIAYLGYNWAHRNWVRQKAIEHDYQQQQLRFDTKIAAYKGAWSLISYMGQMDNPKAMFYKSWEQGKEQLCLFPERIVLFNEAIERVFFAEGHGVLLPKAYKDLLFPYRTKVNRLRYQKGKQTNKAGHIIVPKEDIKYFNTTRQQMTELVRGLMEAERMI